MKNSKPTNNKSGVHVIHIMRSVGPDSMPWADLYRTSLRMAPGMMYPPVIVSPRRCRIVTLWEDCAGENRRHFAAGPLSLLFYIRNVYKRLKSRNQSLVIHVHAPVLGFLSLIAKIFCLHINVVVNLHTDWRFLKPHQKIGIKIAAYIADYLIAVSHSAIETIPIKIRNAMLGNKRLLSIPNGIDVSKIKNYIWAENRSETCVVVASMKPAKNCLFILGLIKRLTTVKHLIWFGDGKEKIIIEDEIEKLGMNNRITLAGIRPRHEVFQALANSSIYISASKWEGIGVANIEAAALGCRPFLSAIPPHKEVAEVINIPTYPLDDMDVWIRDIEEFLALPVGEQEQKRREIADAAQQNFNLDSVVSKYIEIYKSLNK